MRVRSRLAVGAPRTGRIDDHQRKGPIVARKRPRASDDVPPTRPASTPMAASHPSRLTRAEEHALRRSAPLTPSQFKALRQVAEKGGNPLRHI